MDTTKLPLVFTFVLLLVSCGKQNNETNNGNTISNLVLDFPAVELVDIVEEISPQEFEKVIKTNESENWKLFLRDEQNNEIVIKNKHYPDNSIKFVAYFGEKNNVVLAVQQTNGQNVVTNLWQGTLRKNGGIENNWNHYELPLQVVDNFISEKVNLPDEYINTSALPYADISLSKQGLSYTINNWKFLREISESLKSSYTIIDDEALGSFVKYRYELDWNGNEFVSKKLVENGFEELFSMGASVVNDDPDGPGIHEFDCPHGVSVKASSELPAQGGISYKAANVLNEEDNAGWCEGVKGYGVGEWIEFTISGKYSVDNHYQLVNGYNKNEVSWRSNSRVKKFNVLVNDKAIGSVSLQDTIAVQSFRILPLWAKDYAYTKKGDKIRFVIEEVYQGDKYDDTVISYFSPTGRCWNDESLLK